MKRLFACLLAACCLCACEAEPADESSAVLSEEVRDTVSTEPYEETVVPCEHVFGDEPAEIVGNLYIFECVHCGERKVVPQGTLIGGE